MKLDGIVWGVMDGHYIVFIVYTYQFNEPWNWSNHSGGYFNWVVLAVIYSICGHTDAIQMT